MAGDHFLKKADGSLYVAPVWPGPSVFPDFTRQASREWWGGLYKDFVDDGIAGLLERHERAGDLRDADQDDAAGYGAPHRRKRFRAAHREHAEAHNVYGMENSRATYEGLLKLRPNVRPFVMTRATYAGGQRYAVTWTGDNNATWDHLKLMVHQLLNLGLSGWLGRRGHRRMHAQAGAADALAPDRRVHARVPQPFREEHAARRALDGWVAAPGDPPPVH